MGRQLDPRARSWPPVAHSRRESGVPIDDAVDRRGRGLPVRRLKLKPCGRGVRCWRPFEGARQSESVARRRPGRRRRTGDLIVVWLSQGGTKSRVGPMRRFAALDDSVGRGSPPGRIRRGDREVSVSVMVAGPRRSADDGGLGVRARGLPGQLRRSRA